MVHEEDIQLFYVDFPTKIRGRTVANADGTYSVFINARLSYAMQRKAIKHELRHIRKGEVDSDNVVSVQQLEMGAHDLKANQTAVLVPQRKKRRKRNRWAKYMHDRKSLGNVGLPKDSYIIPE